MGIRSPWKPNGRGRALHVERLELRAAPGALLTGAGFFGPTLFDLAAAPQAVVADTPAECSSRPLERKSAAAPAPLLTPNLTSLLLDRTSSNLASATRDIAASLAKPGRVSASPASGPSAEWNALLFGSTNAANRATSADAPILKTSTLNAPTTGGGGGGGGGGANHGGGGASGSARTSLNGSSPGQAFQPGPPAPNPSSPTAPPPATNSPPTLTSPETSPETCAAPQEGTAASAADVAAWSVPTGIGQCAPPAGNPAATFDNSTASGLQLFDAAGNALSVSLDGNTLIIGAATWCGNTVKLKAQLSTPEAQQALSGLRIVWAFGDEGGSGPGGVLKSEFLQGLPGELAFLGNDSVRPWRFPSAFNAETGQFDQHPLDVIESWLSVGQAFQPDSSLAGSQAGKPDLRLTDATGAPLNISLDNNTIVIAAATWCPHCAELKANLYNPDSQAALAGLRIIFAFGNEGGSSPAGVANPEFLRYVPGEVAFLAPDSVQPPAFPMAYNPASGQFDTNATDAIANWYNTVGQAVPDNSANTSATPTGSQADVRQSLTYGAGSDIGSGQEVCTLTGDYNHNGAVDAADYVVWRKQLDLTGAGLAADGNGDLTVNEVDYGIWREHFGEVCQGPGAFTISGPIGVQVQKNNTITWTASPGATSYEFVLSKHADLSSSFILENLTVTSRSVFLHSGTYYVGVKAINGDGETIASNNGFAITVELPPTDQLIYVSAANYSINTTNQYPPSLTSFGSAAAADYHCTAMANQAGLLPEPWDGQKIYFRALVIEGSDSLIERVGLVNDQYYNTAGDLVATDRAALLSGVFTAPIKTYNNGLLVGTHAVWTGANSDGTSSLNKCSNWSSTTGTAQAGNVNGTGSNWLNQAAVNCNISAKLYCVGDRPA